jgi:hypothetical protein
MGRRHALCKRVTGAEVRLAAKPPAITEMFCDFSCFSVCCSSAQDAGESPVGDCRAMNAISDISMKTDDVLRVELEVFRREHRDLDDAIAALAAKGTGDQLTIQRLKKKKLRLKDMIARIEDRLTPDIIA